MSEFVTATTATGQPGRPARSRITTRQVWLERLARFPDSGLTPAQFCAIEAISLPSFYAWRRRLATETRGTDADPDTDARLLPVAVRPQAALLELVLPTGPVLRIPP